jgi:hypothetical protein
MAIQALVMAIQALKKAYLNLKKVLQPTRFYIGALKGSAYPVSSTYPIPFTGCLAAEPLTDTLPSQ